MSIFIAIIINENEYLQGINDIINLFVNDNIVIEKYTYDINSIENETKTIKDSCNSFITKYPSGKRVTISTTTAALKIISQYFVKDNEDIINFSLSATSTEVKTFKNVLTYAPFNQYSVMSNFMIMVDFSIKHIKILYSANTSDDDFYQDYIKLMTHQANLLNYPITVETLEVSKKYKFEDKTAVILLCRTENLVTNYVDRNFINSFKDASECYISLTDINLDCTDIFEDIPAFVLLPTPLNYTDTSNYVYEKISNKSSHSYIVYPFYDILFTLNFYSDLTMPFNLNNYISLNPFTSVNAAWSNSLSFNTKLNGSKYGTFDALFTKNILIGKDIDLFNKYNSSASSLPDSNSLFLTVGITPFFNTQVYYCNENYYKIYKNNELILVRFDKNITKYEDLDINVSEIINNIFLLKYTEDGYFSEIKRINLLYSNLPMVNSTMSKNPIYMGIQ